MPIKNKPIGIKMLGHTQPITPPLARQGILLCLFETRPSKSLAGDFTGFIGDIQASEPTRKTSISSQPSAWLSARIDLSDGNEAP
jgi:hypothetical protein